MGVNTTFESEVSLESGELKAGDWVASDFEVVIKSILTKGCFLQYH